jgi:hypothetical protein
MICRFPPARHSDCETEPLISGRKVAAGAQGQTSPIGPWTATMDLSIWLPSLFILGLVVMALMFAFLAACDRI